MKGAKIDVETTVLLVHNRS